MAVAEVPANVARGSSQSFDGRGEVRRLRLSAEEARLVRYVFCEWSGEVGTASGLGSMLAHAASLATGCHRARGTDLGGGMTAKTSHANVFDANVMMSIERWCEQPRAERDAIGRAWRALRRVGTIRSTSLVVLHALYGDRAPGLLDGVYWGRDVNHEYVRVVRHIDTHDATTSALESRLRIERKPREGEAAADTKARIAASTVARRELLRALGDECERAIVQAAHDYRAASKAV